VVSKALEIARTEKIIGHSLNAKVTIFADKENYDFIEPIKKDLVTVFIVQTLSLRVMMKLRTVSTMKIRMLRE